MKWLSDILCGAAKGLLKFEQGEAFPLDSSNRFRLAASSSKARFKDFPYRAGGTCGKLWLPCGNIRQEGAGGLAKVEHNFYQGIHHINNSVNIFNKPQIKTTKH